MKYKNIFKKTILANSLFFAVILFSLGVKANKIPDCTEKLNVMTIPSVALDGLFEQRKGIGMLPFPTAFCFSKGQTYKIQDEYKQDVGTLTIKNIWRNAFTDKALVTEPKSSLAKIFINYLKEKQILHKGFVEFVIPHLVDLNKIPEDTWKFYLTILNFEYELNPKFMLKVTPYSFMSQHPNAKVITYQELLGFYNSGKHYVINVEGGPGLMAPNHIPEVKFRYYPDSLSEKVFSLKRAVVRFKSLKLPPDKEMNIIVSTPPTQQSAGYNVINSLISNGYKNVFWLNNFSEIFYNRPIKMKAKISPSDMLDVKNVVSLIKSGQAHMVDMRTAEEYNFGTIPGAVSMELYALTSEQYYEMNKNRPEGKRITPLDKIKPGIKYFLLKDAPIPKFGKQVVVFSNHTESLVYEPHNDYQKRSMNLLRENYKVNAKILKDGLEGFYAYTRWNEPDLRPRSPWANTKGQ